MPVWALIFCSICAGGIDVASQLIKVFTTRPACEIAREGMLKSGEKNVRCVKGELIGKIGRRPDLEKVFHSFVSS